MIPTPKLRFVERIETFISEPYGVSTSRKTQILQQWWENNLTINLGWTGDMSIGKPNGEWRDISLETEND
jgi:hypothetical protein